jgi:hypothetical protein
MNPSRRGVLLVQLPIPPPGPQPIRGNVPLAAGYLKMLAEKRGLGGIFAVDILPPSLANVLGDQGLVDEILARGPWLVGFTCYLWNIERSLWIAGRLKQIRPDILIVLGGPEITRDNAWVLEHPAVDYAAIGEGEQTFAELLAALAGHARNYGPPNRVAAIAGLWSRAHVRAPLPRAPLRNLDEICSPYLEGILDVGGEKTLFLETVRGCAFRCKFCYYPKSYDALYFVSPEKVAAVLDYAAGRGATEIVILDPTLNQRRDFADFLRLLASHNPGRQWTCFGELRAEGIDAEKAKLLAAANFTEVEIGLQSLDPRAQQLMDRTVSLKSFERGARAMLDQGIAVRVDLILGLPGDTPDSIRRGIEYLRQSKLYTAVQVFNLSVLPGTAFRQEARQLGLRFQSRPPYYVLETPALSIELLHELMDEAQEAFQLEFDPSAPPTLEFGDAGDGPLRGWRIDLDRGRDELPAAGRRAQAFTLMIHARDFDADRQRAADIVRRLVGENPHSSLDVLLAPEEPARLTTRALGTILGACFASSSYLDLFYSMHPNRLLGAKRLVVVVPIDRREQLGMAWIEQVSEFATIAWQGSPPSGTAQTELSACEYILP